MPNLEAEVAKTGAGLTKAQVTALEGKSGDDLVCGDKEKWLRFFEQVAKRDLFP